MWRVPTQVRTLRMVGRRLQSSGPKEGAKGAYAYTSNKQTPNSTTPREDLEVYKKSQRLQAVLVGLFAITALVGSYQIYQNRRWIKAKISGENFDAESFDNMYQELKQKKKAKQDSILANAQQVTNPNDSSVPGVYICGNNQFKLVEDSDALNVPLFKRLDVFDNFIVKDIFIGPQSGALINEKGDLYQWGKGFGGISTKPSLKGFNLTKVQISNGVVYCLDKKGEVYGLPESSEVQKNQKFDKASGWFGKYGVPYFKLDLGGLKIKDISAGMQHLMLLNTQCQVSTCATGLPGTKLDKSYGQFGLPEFSQFDQPPKPNKVMPVLLLNKFQNDQGEISNRVIEQIGSGNYECLCRDSLGGVWAWGWNKYGITGKQLNFDSEFIAYPVKVDTLDSKFKKTDLAKCLDLKVGGDTVFAKVVISDIYKLFEQQYKPQSQKKEKAAEDETKYFVWGHGLNGSLGLGTHQFIHFTNEPHEVKAFNVMEYSEALSKMVPIGIKNLSIGNRHCFAEMANGDVLSWGDGTLGQLANGGKNRRGLPDNVPQLLEPAGSATKKTKYNDRLQLKTFGDVKQEIYAGYDTTAIVYKKI